MAHEQNCLVLGAYAVDVSADATAIVPFGRRRNAFPSPCLPDLDETTNAASYRDKQRPPSGGKGGEPAPRADSVHGYRCGVQTRICSGSTLLAGQLPISYYQFRFPIENNIFELVVRLISLPTNGPLDLDHVLMGGIQPNTRLVGPSCKGGDHMHMTRCLP